MKRVFLALAILLSTLTVSAQTPAPAPAPAPLFTVSTQAVAIRLNGTTAPGTDLIGSFNLTPNVQLQTDNILAPSINLQSYLGGVKASPAFLAKPLAKTSLSNIKPYIHVAVGITRNVPATGQATQHYAALAGGGFDWSANNTISFGPRISFFSAPGFGASPHGVMVSANLSVILAHK